MKLNTLSLGMLIEWVENALASWGRGQAELARRMTALLGRNIHATAVNKFLKGGRQLSTDEMLAISEITGYPVLISLKGDTLRVVDPDKRPEYDESYLVKLLTTAFEWRGLPPDKARNLSASLVGAARRSPDRQEFEMSEEEARRIVLALAAAFDIPPPR